MSNDKFTTDEKMIFFYLLNTPEHLNDSKKLFENKKYGRLSYYISNFYNEYNKVPSTAQIIESLEDINAGAVPAGQWTRSMVDELFDTSVMSSVDPQWLEDQFMIWYSIRSVEFDLKAMVDTFTLNSKNKNLKDLILPYAERLIKHNGMLGEKANMFECKTMNEWMDQAKNNPKPKQLFSSLIFEKETCILFGGPNSGKSTLAIQLCDSWTNGTNIDGFINDIKEPQSVLYVDFETSESQLYMRMHDEDENVTKNFNENFHRASIKDGDQKFKESLEYHIIKTKCKILVFDNISYLQDDAEKGKNSIQLIKQLKAMREKFGLTIIVIAHTPKIDETQMLSMDHLQGSKMLSNLVDSVVGMKRLLMDDDKTYLKQLKVRSSAMEFGYDNVCLLSKGKKNGMLSFKLEDTFEESVLTDNEKARNRNDERDQKIQKLNLEGKSVRDIAKEMMMDKSKISRILGKFKSTDKIKLDTHKQNDFLSGNLLAYEGL